MRTKFLIKIMIGAILITGCLASPLYAVMVSIKTTCVTSIDTLQAMTRSPLTNKQHGIVSNDPVTTVKYQLVISSKPVG